MCNYYYLLILLICTIYEGKLKNASYLQLQLFNHIILHDYQKSTGDVQCVFSNCDFEEIYIQDIIFIE